MTLHADPVVISDDDDLVAITTTTKTRSKRGVSKHRTTSSTILKAGTTARKNEKKEIHTSSNTNSHRVKESAGSSVAIGSNKNRNNNDDDVSVALLNEDEERRRKKKLKKQKNKKRKKLLLQQQKQRLCDNDHNLMSLDSDHDDNKAAMVALHDNSAKENEIEPQMNSTTSVTADLNVVTTTTTEDVMLETEEDVIVVFDEDELEETNEPNSNHHRTKRSREPSTPKTNREKRKKVSHSHRASATAQDVDLSGNEKAKSSPLNLDNASVDEKTLDSSKDNKKVDNDENVENTHKSLQNETNEDNESASIAVISANGDIRSSSPISRNPISRETTSFLETDNDNNCDDNNSPKSKATDLPETETFEAPVTPSKKRNSLESTSSTLLQTPSNRQPSLVGLNFTRSKSFLMQPPSTNAVSEGLVMVSPSKGRLRSLAAEQALKREKEAETIPRLVIEKLVLDNFKSYAGIQEIGPFHSVCLFFKIIIIITL